MKRFNILGVALLLATLTVLVGVNSAMGDEWCTASAVSNMCPAGKVITTVESTLTGTAKLTDTAGNTLLTCTGGHRDLSNISQGTGTRPIGMTVGRAIYTVCSNEVTTIANGTASAVEGAGGGATLTEVGSEVTTKVFGVSCTYGTGTGTDLGEINSSGELVINAVVNKTAGSFLCPSTVRWDATFLMTNHSSFHYITN